MAAATLTEKGQVIIPAEIRARYELTPGPSRGVPHAPRPSAAAATRIPAPPRRSTSTRRATSGSSPSSSTRDTRKPPSPKIRVQSASDPTRPPSLFAHQEKTPSDPPMASGIALPRPGRRAGRPPQQRPAQAAGSSAQIVALKSAKSPETALPPESRSSELRSVATGLAGKLVQPTPKSATTTGE